MQSEFESESEVAHGASCLLKNEQRILDALAENETVKAAAIKLGLEPQTIYNWIQKTKTKYKRRKCWLQEMEFQMRRSGLTRKVFSERKEIAPVLHQLDSEEGLPADSVAPEAEAAEKWGEP